MPVRRKKNTIYLKQTDFGFTYLFANFLIMQDTKYTCESGIHSSGGSVQMMQPLDSQSPWCLKPHYNDQ